MSMTHDDRTSRTPVHWTSLVLHFADGSGLVSTWDRARGRASQQASARRMTEEAATAEHLRALAEFHDTGGTTNWFVSPSRDAIDSVDLEAVDWSDFKPPNTEL
jgi:hypothetical protein